MSIDEVLAKHGFERGFSSCGDGWAGLLDEMLTTVRLFYTPAQCSLDFKEKYGGLRVSLDLVSDPDWEGLKREVADIIRDVEDRSYFICERCGEPGECREDLSWILTLCETHYALAAEIMRHPAQKVVSDAG